MVHSAKMLVFLCALIGWSQTFPQRDVINEDKDVTDADSKKTEGKDVKLIATDVTPPVCRVVNESSECLLTCEKTTIEVTYMMSDGNGSGINHTRTFSNSFSFSKYTQYDGQDENGYYAVLLKYSGICCSDDLEVSAVDNAGNIGKCPVIVKRIQPDDSTKLAKNFGPYWA